MRYGITGATGFVGGALSCQLRAAGHDVAALVRDASRAGALADQGVELITGDLDDAQALDRLCAGIDGLFHVAGWYKLGQRDPSVGERVNVGGTRNALEAARRNDVPRVVYTSTLAINSDTRGRAVDETYRFEGQHISAYDRTKAEAHDIAQRFADEGLEVVMVQPGVVYGPGDTAKTGSLVEQVVCGKRVLAPKGGGMCWAHVDDIAQGHVLAMGKGRPGESYMLAGPQATLAEALQMTARIADTKGPLLLPEAAIRLTAAVSSRVGTVVPLPSDYAAETLRASQATYLGTSAKAERELGWEARRLEEGLRQTVEAIRC